MKIKLKNVRLSFPAIFKKAVFNGEETKYEATFLLDKVEHSDDIKAIDAYIKSLIAEDLKGSKLSADKICLRDGDESQYEGFAGHMSIKASSTRRPLVINHDRSPITEEDGIVYAGCYVNAIIELWAQNNSWGKRINASLSGVQFSRHGEPFGDRSSALANDFDIVEDEDDIKF